MKGLIFTSFLHFVEKEYGLEIVDEVIVESAIPSGGIYTTVGDYNHTELIAMIVALSKKKLACLRHILPKPLVSTFLLSSLLPTHSG